MKASKANRKKRRHVPVPIASMGDIAFLLIIFFLVEWWVDLKLLLNLCFVEGIKLLEVVNLLLA